MRIDIYTADCHDIQQYKRSLAEAMIPRYLDLPQILAKKSCFLFGPRQTGKSTLARQQLPHYPIYNLLDQSLYLRLSQNPALIRQSLQPADSLIIIDEIQKMPVLLNEVQLMIDEHAIRFLLTGSSSRSLRRKGVNLLGGRARSRNLHPFIRKELGDHFSLDRALTFGLIPSIYFSDSPTEDLAAYAGDYLREEIAAEAAVRNVGAFSRFLEVAALAHGQMINFAGMANDAQVPASTIREYYQIMKDTFLAHEVPAFTETRKRKSISTSKYYLFDIGLVRNIQRRQGLAPGTPEYGNAFESYIFQEIKAHCDYNLLPTPAYWRSKSQFEVDFILEETAIEVKAKRSISTRDLKGIKAFKEENLKREYIVVCMEPQPRLVDGIRIMPWQHFLDELWS